MWKTAMCISYIHYMHQFCAYVVCTYKVYKYAYKYIISLPISVFGDSRAENDVLIT